MLQTNTVASLGIFTVLGVCILGMGFMVRFFIALTGEKGNIRAVHDVRSKRGHSRAVRACEEQLRSEAAVNSTGYLARGVVRSNRSRFEPQGK